jgi:hypothetical protein
VLDRRRSRHLHRCGVVAGRATTRAWERGPLRRAPRRREPRWPRPAQRAQAAPAWPWALRRVATGRARAVRVGRADAAGVGQALLCIWAERGFGPETPKLIFLFSDLFNSLQIQKFV